MEINIKTTSKEIADLVSELQSRPLKLKEALKIDAETIAKAVQIRSSLWKRDRSL